MSRMLAVAPDAGRSASVVVAELLEITTNLAYGVEVAPTATRSVVVESVMLPILLVVQPPPDEAPETFIEPQEISPWLLVCSACEPVHDAEPESVSVESKRPVPETSSVFLGLLVAMPTLPAKYAVPVVVAPPLTVSPPPCVPSPMVVEAVKMLPPVQVLLP